MRNPLSAIVQCADTITTSMNDITKLPLYAEDTVLSEIIRNSVDAAETIQLCAQHQKGIVDDILTISKLDSNLLLITPLPIQPVRIVKQGKHLLLQLHIPLWRSFLHQQSKGNYDLSAKTNIDSSSNVRGRMLHKQD